MNLTEYYIHKQANDNLANEISGAIAGNAVHLGASLAGMKMLNIKQPSALDMIGEYGRSSFKIDQQDVYPSAVPRYDPITDKVYVNIKHRKKITPKERFVAYHELGHKTVYNKVPKHLHIPRLAYMVATGLPRRIGIATVLPSVAAIPFLPEKYKNKAAVAASLPHLIVLADEMAANAVALKNLSKLHGLKKSLFSGPLKHKGIIGLLGNTMSYGVMAASPFIASKISKEHEKTAFRRIGGIGRKLSPIEFFGTPIIKTFKDYKPIKKIRNFIAKNKKNPNALKKALTYTLSNTTPIDIPLLVASAAIPVPGLSEAVVLGRMTGTQAIKDITHKLKKIDSVKHPLLSGSFTGR